MSRRFILLPELKQKVGLGKTTIYKLERAEKFPKRVRISTNRVGWVESEIEIWMEAQALKRSRGEEEQE